MHHEYVCSFFFIPQDLLSWLTMIFISTLTYISSGLDKGRAFPPQLHPRGKRIG